MLPQVTRSVKLAETSEVVYTPKMVNKNEIKTIRTWLGSDSINVFGKPFAGKDSQSRRLAKILNGIALSGGDILRASELPAESQECLKTGKLIPSNDYVDIVLPFLSRAEFRNKPLILSSVGRWHGEEPGVIDALQASHHKIKQVIYLKISDRDVFERQTRRETFKDRGARQDDTLEILRIRLREFEEKTLPVIEFYRQHELLTEIDGTLSREAVCEEIVEELYQASRA